MNLIPRRGFLRIPLSIVFLGLPAFAGSAWADLTLTNMNVVMKGVQDSAVQWGDYDNDGLLDFILTGDTLTSGGGYTARIYHNTGNGFTDIRSGTIQPVIFGANPWGDYDKDDDLDFFEMGQASGNDMAAVFRNEGNNFFRRVSGTFPPAEGGAAVWFDCDNDGDLDLVESGFGTQLFRNDGNGIFTEIGLGSGLPTGDDYFSIAWGDFDNDGYTDMMLGGVLERNLGNGKWSPRLFPNPYRAVNALGDFDNDGDLDVFVSGDGVSGIFRNDGPAGFVDMGAGIDSLHAGSAEWIDFDNDGYLDLFVTGFNVKLPNNASTAKTHLYHNDQFGHFIPVPVDVAPGGCASDWGDFDNDGRVDLLLTGIGLPGAKKKLGAVYRADGVPTNAPPGAPTGLTGQIIGNQLLMSWNAATDDHTPSSGLSYNVRVGTHPGGDDVMCAMADPVTGFRRIARLGNASERTWMKMPLPPTWDVLYWSVQAIDGQYAGSSFAPEQVIGGSVPALPTSISAEAGPDGVHLVWYRAGTLGEMNTVYRRETVGDWIARGTAVTGDSPQTLSFTDVDVRPGERYAYRLAIPDGSTERFTEEVWVDVPIGSVAFALEPVQPNPTLGGDLHVSFSLATAATASLALVDARGRMVTTESFSGAGRYSATLRGAHLENGRYFVRLEQAGKTLVRPLTVVE